MLVDLSNIQTLANYMQARQRWTLGCSQSVRMYTCMCICMPSKNSFFKCMSVHLNAIYLSGSHLITYQFLARKFERFKRTLKFSKHATYVQRWTGEAIVSCPETHIPDERKKITLVHERKKNRVNCMFSVLSPVTWGLSSTTQRARQSQKEDQQESEKRIRGFSA